MLRYERLNRARIIGLLLLLATTFAPLAACTPSAADATPTAAAVTALPTPTTAQVEEPTSAPEMTAVPATATTAAPEVTPTHTPAPLPTPEGGALPPNYFAYVFGSFFGENGEVSVRGITTRDGGPEEVAMVPLPVTHNLWDMDYEPATNRVLYWDYSASVETGGVGPGNLSAGALYLIDLNSNQEAPLLPENVVNAAWAPNGTDFAYILGNDETYQLIYWTAGASERVLATDVPHTFSFSPDGKLIAFTRESNYNLPSEPGLYVVNVETGEESKLSDVDRQGAGGIGDPFRPMWAPDGSSVLLLNGAAGPYEWIWAAADGSREHVITADEMTAAVDAAAAAFPEGNWCAYPELVLFDGTNLVTGASACVPPEQTMGQVAATHLAVLELDPATGAVEATALTPTEAERFYLLAWNVIGESVFVNFPETEEVATAQLQP
jgi:hypothetical protein